VNVAVCALHSASHRQRLAPHCIPMLPLLPVGAAVRPRLRGVDFARAFGNPKGDVLAP
jgi:hypothetical protein